MSEEQLLSVREVAVHLGVSTTAVYEWLKRGELVLVEIGKLHKRKFVTLASVERFEARRSTETDSDEPGRVSPLVATA